MPPNRFESEVESFLEGSHGDRTHIKRADHHTVTPLCGTLLFREALPLRVGVTRSPEVVARLKKSVMPLLQGAGVLPYRCGISVAVGEVGCVSPESHVVVPSSPLTVWSTVAETHGSSARARSEHPRRGNDATAVATRVAQRFGGAHRPSDANPTRRPGKRLHQEALNNVHTGLV